MPNIETKLETFDRKIIEDAIMTRNGILGQMRRDSERKLTDMKEEIIRQTGRDYQEFTRQAISEKDSQLSKATVSSRKTLINARNGIILSALGTLSDKLSAFTQTAEYGEYFFKNFREAQELAGIGDGQYAVYLTPRDYALYADQIKKSSPGADVLTGSEDMIGGTRIENPGSGVFVDNSLKKKVELCSDELFRLSGLQITNL